MMLRTLLLVGLATLASSLRLDSLVSRRAAVIAAAGSLSVPWAAHAVDKKAVDGVVERAKAGKLTTEGVIGRALLNDMVDPKQIPDCKALSSVLNIDREADAELKAVNSKLSKLSKAAAKNAGDDPSPDQIKIAETLKDALAISNTAEKRVADRVMLIDGRFNVECVAG